MLELAYSQGIITDDVGRRFIQSKKEGPTNPAPSKDLDLPPPQGPAAKGDLLAQTIEKEIGLVDLTVHYDETDVGGTQVVGDFAGKETHLSLEYWRERAFKA